ncbi:MAG: methylated-DNA--[protein]-cysteine S-methyltransferase [Muribaculaceae bacterium]
MHYQYYYNSPIGTLAIESNGTHITRLYRWIGQTQSVDIGNCQPIVMAVEWLNRYFSGSDPGQVPALMPSGSEFALKTYRAASTIGYSQTATYAHIASLIGSPGAARAVGRALGANPILIMIPCHRILGSDGSLTGFAAGLEVKRALLDLESGKTVLPRL